MVSTCPPTSKSSSPFSNPLVTVPNAPITIGIIVTFMFHSFFDSLARSWYLSFFSHSFSFILCSVETAKLSTILQVLFLLIIIRSGLLAEIWWSVCMSKPHRSSCVLFSRTGAGLCIYHFLVFKFKFLAHLPVDHLADPSVLICCIRLLCDWYYYYLTPFRVFSHLRLPMVPHWSLSDSKSAQVFMTLLSFLTDLNNVVVLMVSTLRLISKSSSPCTNIWWLYQRHQLQLVSSSLSCSTVFSIP